jgi:hypothetical protein
MAEPDRSNDFKRELAAQLDELENMFGADDIAAVSIAIVRRNGDVRTLNSCDLGQKVALVAAATLAAHGTIQLISRTGSGMQVWNDGKGT